MFPLSTVWEISTGRCLRTFNFQGIIKWVAWNPSPKLFLLAVVVGNKVFCLNPETYLTDRVVVRQTNAVFRVEPDKGDDQSKFSLVCSCWRYFFAIADICRDSLYILLSFIEIDLEYGIRFLKYQFFFSVGKQFERVRTAVTWRKPDATEWSNGIRVVLEHFKDVKQVSYLVCKET